MTAADLEQALAEAGTADVVVGLPSFNNAETLGPVLEAARTGLGKFFGGARVALVVSDAASTDGTLEVAGSAEWPGPRVLARHASPPDERVVPLFHGVPGRAAAQRTILEAARRLEARACVLLRADCRSTEPEWIDRLLRPVLEDGYDYVAPLFQRHRYDGTLTACLIAPLCRAFYGRRVRQPLGGPNALSAALVGRLCEPEEWRPEVVRHGIDLLMMATASAGGFRVCEAWLGTCVLAPQRGAGDIALTFAQAVGATLALLEHTPDAWRAVRGSEAVPVVGRPLPAGAERREIDVGRMVAAFRRGLKDLLPLWDQVLAQDTLAEVLALGLLPDDGFAFPPELWARVVSDFVLGYHLRILYREHLLRSLVPLYLAQVAALVRETMDRDAGATERRIERTCGAFERQKRSLAERWEWGA